jgi:hypothetical protein
MAAEAQPADTEKPARMRGKFEGQAQNDQPCLIG